MYQSTSSPCNLVVVPQLFLLTAIAVHLTVEAEEYLRTSLARTAAQDRDGDDGFSAVCQCPRVLATSPRT